VVASSGSGDGDGGLSCTRRKSPKAVRHRVLF
jgi:hypothetical protein